MRYGALIGTVAFCVLAGQRSLGQSGAHVEFIDMGTPTNGDVVMSGWRGVIVRVVLDSGEPIRQVNFGGNTFGGFIAGNIAQRWTDPTGQFNYTQTSPGPLTANNTFASDFNFDSHFLGPAARYNSTAVTEFNASPGDFLTSRTGLVSNGSVGYGAATLFPFNGDPIHFRRGGNLTGVLDIATAFQASAIDAAYIVTDSDFQVSALVLGPAGAGGLANGIYQVPEPGGILGWCIGAVVAVLRRKPKQSISPRNSVFETLEARLQLAAPIPTNVSASMQINGSAKITWDNMGAGITYSVDRSATGTALIWNLDNL